MVVGIISRPMSTKLCSLVVVGICDPKVVSQNTNLSSSKLYCWAQLNLMIIWPFKQQTKLLGPAQLDWEFNLSISKLYCLARLNLIVNLIFQAANYTAGPNSTWLKIWSFKQQTILLGLAQLDWEFALSNSKPYCWAQLNLIENLIFQAANYTAGPSSTWLRIWFSSSKLYCWAKLNLIENLIFKQQTILLGPAQLDLEFDLSSSQLYCWAQLNLIEHLIFQAANYTVEPSSTWLRIRSFKQQTILLGPAQLDWDFDLSSSQLYCWAQLNLIENLIFQAANYTAGPSTIWLRIWSFKQSTILLGPT